MITKLNKQDTTNKQGGLEDVTNESIDQFVYIALWKRKDKPYSWKKNWVKMMKLGLFFNVHVLYSLLLLIKIIKWLM